MHSCKQPTCVCVFSPDGGPDSGKIQALGAGVTWSWFKSSYSLCKPGTVIYHIRVSSGSHVRKTIPARACYHTKYLACCWVLDSCEISSHCPLHAPLPWSLQLYSTLCSGPFCILWQQGVPSYQAQHTWAFLSTTVTHYEMGLPVGCWQGRREDGKNHKLPISKWTYKI